MFHYHGYTSDFTTIINSIGNFNTISILESNKRYVRTRPNNYSQLILNYGVDIYSNIYECNLDGCKLCDNNICELCFDNYELNNGNCI